MSTLTPDELAEGRRLLDEVRRATDRLAGGRGPVDEVRSAIDAWDRWLAAYGPALLAMAEAAQWATADDAAAWLATRSTNHEEEAS